MRFPQLITSPLFKGITEEEAEEIFGRINYRVRLYRAGSMIAQSSENIYSLLIVLSGHVRGEMTDIAGHIIKIEDIYPPQALAAAFIFGSGSQFPVNVYANIDSEVLIIDKNDYLTIMHENKTMLVNYLNLICTKARFLSDRLRFLSFRTIKGKLAHYIVSLPGSGSGSVVMDRSQQQLADYFGVARPSLARALGEMEDSGIIIVERRRITITRMDELALLTQL